MRTKEIIFFKNRLLLTLMLISVPLVLAGCGQGQNSNTAGSISANGEFTANIPKDLQKHRTGMTLTAELVVDGGTPIDLVVDLENDRVTTSQVNNLTPGSQTFTISYFLNGTLVASAISTVEIIAGQTTNITPEMFQLNQDLDGDGVSGMDEVISGADPNNAASTPQVPNGVIDTPIADQTIVLGGSVNFTGTGTDSDGNTPLTYLWDFAGGAINATVEDPGLVTFNTPGIYNVTFTVTDSLGIADPTPDTRTITVTTTTNIDFEMLSDGISTPTGSAANEYASLGVTFAGGGTAGQPFFRNFNTLTTLIATRPIGNNWFITTQSRNGGGTHFDLDIFLSNPVSNVSGDVVINPSFSLTASAFDAAGNVLASNVIPAGASTWIAGSFSFSTVTPIARINLLPSGISAAAGLDNLTFE